MGACDTFRPQGSQVCTQKCWGSRCHVPARPTFTPSLGRWVWKGGARVWVTPKPLPTQQGQALSSRGSTATAATCHSTAPPPTQGLSPQALAEMTMQGGWGDTPESPWVLMVPKHVSPPTDTCQSSSSQSLSAHPSHGPGTSKRYQPQPQTPLHLAKAGLTTGLAHPDLALALDDGVQGGGGGRRQRL